jgi:hypothetical protein
MNDDPLPDPGARVLWLAAALTSREGPHQLSGDSGVSNRLREPTSDLSGALTSREGPHQLSGDSGVSNRLLEPTSDLSGALTSREGPRQLSGDSGALCIARELSFNADVPHARSHRASRSKAALIGSLVCVLLAMALTAVIAIGQLTLSDSRGQLAIDRMVELASSSARPAPARSATQPALHIEWVPAVSPAPAQPQLDREESTAAPPVSPVLAQPQIDREESTAAPPVSPVLAQRQIDREESTAAPPVSPVLAQPQLDREESTAAPPVSPVLAQPQLDREESTAAPPVSPVLAQPQIDREESTAAPPVSPVLAQRQLDREESTAAPPVSPVLAQRQIDREEITVLINRGKDLIANGDLAAARLVLQRAADANDAEAALALAATYDPVVLRELKVYGFTADAAMARAWYQRARELGSAAALKRLEILITGAR